MNIKPPTTTDKELRLEHWKKAYKSSYVPSYPSQFAVFVCDYLNDNQNIIEFGCGSGRDSLFFASQGHRVLGFDASDEAIKSCRLHSSDANRKHVEFHQLNIDEAWDTSEIEKTSQFIRSVVDTTRPTLIYARFFLHAITEEEEQSFLRILEALESSNMTCAFEFRTHRDQKQHKITTPHYRRFINPVGLLKRLELLDYKLDYFVEGFGMAKYKTEDAHVARIVLQAPAKIG